MAVTNGYYSWGLVGRKCPSATVVPLSHLLSSRRMKPFHRKKKKNIWVSPMKVFTNVNRQEVISRLTFSTFWNGVMNYGFCLLSVWAKLILQLTWPFTENHWKNKTRPQLCEAVCTVDSGALSQMHQYAKTLIMTTLTCWCLPPWLSVLACLNELISAKHSAAEAECH